MNDHIPLLDRRESLRKGVYILPNLFTTGSLFAGFYGVVSSMNARYDIAAWFILVSSIFDALDGKVARLTGTTSPFGVATAMPTVLLELDAVTSYGLVGAAPLATYLVSLAAAGWWVMPKRPTRTPRPCSRLATSSNSASAGSRAVSPCPWSSNRRSLAAA